MDAPPERAGELRLRGIGVSRGIVRARAHVIGLRFEEPEDRSIKASEVAAEHERLQAALTRTREQIREMQSEIDSTVGSDHAVIFDAHLLVLEDATVLDEVRRSVATQLRSVERVYFEVTRRYLDSLRKISDPYLRERAVDIEDVAKRVIQNLRSPRHWNGAGSLNQTNSTQPCLMVAHDLAPSDTVAINREQVLGFATEAGSPTSHTAIIARSLGIPAVVGIRDLLGQIHPGDVILIDGSSGSVIIRPTEETIEEYDKLRDEQSQVLEQLSEFKDRETTTADGHRITLSANIEFVEELSQVTEKGAEGVGLYRTEFFYMNEAELRGEEPQFKNYAQVAEGVAPHSVIIRTLDIGGDKLWPEANLESEPNPFLGWRGIRVSITRPALFKVQLRAILRASAQGKVKIMYPFISCVEEVREANRILDEVRADLDREGIPYDRDIEVGAMIEIPSAVLVADALAKEVDFFSIGTNDLIQYTTAVDRINERVSSLYQPAHPAVVRLIKMTTEAGKRNGIWTGVCGEVAGDVRFAPIMIGAGVDELSVGAAQILPVKKAISALRTDECETLVDAVIQMSCAEEVGQCCENLAREKYPELLG